MSFSQNRFCTRNSAPDFTRQAHVVHAPARQANGESIPCFSHCSVIDIFESPVNVCQVPDGSFSLIVIIGFYDINFLHFARFLYYVACIGTQHHFFLGSMQLSLEEVVLGLVPIIFLFFFYATRQKIQRSSQVY